MAYKVEKQGEKTWYSFSLPIVEDWAKVSKCPDEEYEAWTKNYVKDTIHFVTFEIPYDLILGSQELMNKLVAIKLAYSQMETITKNGITYLSHIDITDVKEYLTKEEFAKFKGAGIKFPPEVEALFEDKKNEKPTT